MKGTESVAFAAVVLLIIVGLIGTAGVAAFDSSQWVDYLHLFDESRLVSPYHSTCRSCSAHKNGMHWKTALLHGVVLMLDHPNTFSIAFCRSLSLDVCLL